MKWLKLGLYVLLEKSGDRTGRYLGERAKPNTDVASRKVADQGSLSIASSDLGGLQGASIFDR